MDNNNYPPFIMHSVFYLENKYKDFFKIDRLMNVQIFSSRISSFIHLVNYWSQILGYVIYGCKNYTIRKKIVMNLMDENCGNITHVETFYKFLVECGFEESLESIKSNHVIQKYQDLLSGYITNHSFEEACAILGSIEYVYHMMSAEINKYFFDKLEYQPQNHYTTHELVDIKHATDLFDCTNEIALQEKFLDMGAMWIIECFSELLNFTPVFGYTYEDAKVEIEAISAMNVSPKDGLIILSGGDTMFELSNKIENLTAVDMNLGQVRLVFEKIFHLENESYEKFLLELEEKNIVYDKLFCKLKSGDSFENVFDAESLKKDFGENAVKNTSENFANHFHKVSDQKGIYHQWIFERDLRIKVERSKEFDLDQIKKVKIEHSLFESKLTPDSYDFIQTSNITDWMDNQQFLKFCEKVKLSLRCGGVLVMRRLASNNYLRQQFEGSILVEDKTEIYSETIVWKK